MDDATAERICDFLEANLPPATGWVLHFARGGEGISLTEMRVLSNVSDQCIADGMRSLYNHVPPAKNPNSDAN